VGGDILIRCCRIGELKLSQFCIVMTKGHASAVCLI
jgi:hypothetical protein